MPLKLTPEQEPASAATTTAPPESAPTRSTPITRETAVPASLNRKGSVLEILHASLDIKRFQNSSIWLYILAGASLAWFLGKLFSLLDFLGKWIGKAMGLVIDLDLTKDSLAGRAWEAVIPAVVLLALGGGIYRHVKRNMPVPTGPMLPERRQALIFMLSPYYGRKSPQAFDTFEELQKEVSEAWGQPARVAQLRQKLLYSNWGPLVISAEYHPLTHLFLIVTAGSKGSEAQKETAREIVRMLRPASTRQERQGRLEGVDLVLPDANDLDSACGVCELAYRRARFEYDLPDATLMADLTGGTAVMTAALAMTCQRESRAMQYLRQQEDNRGLLRPDGTPMLLEEVVEAGLLSAVSRNDKAF